MPRGGAGLQETQGRRPVPTWGPQRLLGRASLSSMIPQVQQLPPSSGAKLEEMCMCWELWCYRCPPGHISLQVFLGHCKQLGFSFLINKIQMPVS